MDKYKYSIQLRYIKKKENISQEIKSTRIRSVIIDKDYSSNIYEYYITKRFIRSYDS